MRKFLFILLILPLSLFAQVDTTQKSLVNWMTIEQAEQLNKTTPKPILIDIYTHWCSWCKYMMKTTYSTPNIAGYINTYFYPVQIDAETSDTLTYGGKQYVQKGKYNQLAVELMGGKMSFPTTIFISKNNHKIAVPGYLKVAHIEPLLVYFAEDLMNSVAYNDFNKAYIFKFPKNYVEELEKMKPEEKLDTLGKPQWLTFNEAFEKSKTTKKKYILFAQTSWCYSCKVMEKITFSNSTIAKEINKNFYLISFDAATEDTISVNGKEYKSMGKGQPNELAMELFQKQFYFPSLIVLDEDFKLLTVIKGYFTAQQIEPILQYFSSDEWKTVKFEDYIKTFESKL